MATRWQRDRGAAAVEFALVAPLLLLLVFAIVSFGFMLSFRQTLSQAAAEGARAAAVQLDSTRRSGDGTKAVNDALAAVDVSCTGNVLYRDGAAAGSCTVTTGTCANDATHDCVTVTLSFRYADHPTVPSVPPVGAFMPEQLSYTATVRVS